jgi:hypothetical protein
MGNKRTFLGDSLENGAAFACLEMPTLLSSDQYCLKVTRHD